MKQRYARFNGGEKRKIHLALSRYLGMDAHNRRALIKEIERTGTFRVFGYGSLILAPHIRPDTEFPGHVMGTRRGPYFADRHFRGTPTALSVTMGIVPANASEKLHGKVQVIKIGAAKPGETFAGRVLESIHAFALRESGLNPIYDYQIVEARSQFGRVKTVICGTDKRHSQFLGDRLSLEEAAAIIAFSSGVLGASSRNTGLAYWRFILDCSYKTGKEPEPHIKKLVSMANSFRLKLPADLQNRLAVIENIPERAAFDERVFETDTNANAASPVDVAAYLQSAKVKLGTKDPLEPNKLKVVLRNAKELKAVLRPKYVYNRGRLIPRFN